MDTIRDFTLSENEFLSPHSPHGVVLSGTFYQTVEHAFQAAKTFETNERDAIRDAATTAQAKALGRTCTMRPDWEQVKLRMMEQLLFKKYRIHRHLQTKLIQTMGVELINENTTGDKFWGVCDGEGENHLGKILMSVRTQLQEEENANS